MCSSRDTLITTMIIIIIIIVIVVIVVIVIVMVIVIITDQVDGLEGDVQRRLARPVGY